MKRVTSALDDQHSDKETSFYDDDDASSINAPGLKGEDEHEQPPPSYSAVGHDGRVNLDLDSKFALSLRALVPVPKDYEEPPPGYEYPTALGTDQPIPGLNIVVQIVGSRGDVQPFIALGCELQKHGHRVRIATHDNFREFVTSSGLEYYPIGGDPNELMAYMVKTPGLIPSMDTIAAGEISKKRKMVHEMLQGCWRSCLYPGPDSAEPKPFVADAIIANPPSFAHIHCAQALGIPLHMMFTMPWTATKGFPHPLANVRRSEKNLSVGNYLSYAMVEWLTWQGLEDVINTWREEDLNIEPVPLTEGPFLQYTQKIPFTYCWSGALVPKPADWPQYIDVCGFFFRDPPHYDPPAALVEFLEAGPAPIYIGFGSIVVDDPDALTAILLEAIALCGQRVLLSSGWSKLRTSDLPANVFPLGDCPHEWLFQQVSAVVHHGGAGTTACGLKYSRPTTIVPFFGDQPFWGEMIAAAGAGPMPIAFKSLSPQNLADAIRFCLTPGAIQAAARISEMIASETGVQSAVASFHRNLPHVALSCDVLPDQPAVWTYKGTKGSKKVVKLSKVAAETLIVSRRIKAGDLGMNESKPVFIEHRRWDPITGGASAAISAVYDTSHALGASMTKKGGLDFDDSENARAKNFAKASSSLVKGAVIDMPMALADGLRHAPRMYGDKGRDYGQITGIKSGLSMAGKGFALGIYDGLSGIVMDPIRGGMKDGAAGVAKGFGTGLMSSWWKTSADLKLWLVSWHIHFKVQRGQ
ncbi:UDP-Glycosyltransferase/glycogen phosphorylase [Aureobasidium sp. EXF-8845]|nr:UDP-Glycosyltransferase/glycogen phosphorylase [Aureobasidium sp. EXF-8845]KAI4844495.1 UDP-Glycosyltransferase/glycogen phosphorylase [Aureobasidium sp. EXF-8846]